MVHTEQVHPHLDIFLILFMHLIIVVIFGIVDIQMEMVKQEIIYKIVIVVEIIEVVGIVIFLKVQLFKMLVQLMVNGYKYNYLIN